MMKPAIEDEFIDILSKASTGQGLGARELAERAGLEEEQVRALKDGRFDAAVARKVAHVLGLDEDAFVEAGEGTYDPAEPPVDNLKRITTPFPVPGYEEMTVNAYLASDPQAGVAVAFDSGAHAGPLIKEIRDSGLTLKAVFLTHTHRDHIADLERLLRENDHPPLYVSENEPHAGAGTIAHKQRFSFGGLTIEARSTPGHSPGGMTYQIDGLERPVAVVGDAVFAGSIGGASSQYEDALRAIEEQILSLNPETVLCPGHGPMRTLADERRHNPFLAAMGG